MSQSAIRYLLPDVEPSWRLLKSLSSGSGEAVVAPAELTKTSSPVVIGLPATACRTLGIILPDTEAALLPAMIEAQLEKRGVSVEKIPALNYVWHVLGHGAGLSLVSVDVLSNPFPTELALPGAANYTPALRLMQLPAGELVVLEEQALYVLAASHHGRLWHSHVLGSVEMTAEDLARELQMAQLSLESQEGYGAVSGVALVGDRLSTLKTALRTLLDCPVETLKALEPNRALKTETLPLLLPAAVHAAQNSRSRGRKFAAAAMLTVLLYAVLFAAGWWYLKSLQDQQATLQARIEETRDPAAEVRTTAQRWRSLEPAIETSRYPMVQLAQITSIMPPSGVLLRKFIAKPTEIELTGDSRDAQTATQFLEDLKKQPKLNRYTWTMPVPTVKDKVASFKIQGKLEGS